MAFSILFTSCGDNSTIDFGNEARFCFDAEKTAVAFRYGPVIDTEGNYMKIKEDLKITDLFLVFEKIPSFKSSQSSSFINFATQLFIFLR